MECRLCGALALPLRLPDGAYEECPACGFVQKTLTRLPKPEEERRRYLQHHNDPDDPGYRSWMLSFVRSALEPWLKPGMKVLDYGSGPTPLMERLLAGRGLEVRSYDPYFCADASWEGETWDVAIVHEVAEHLAWPRRSLDCLAARLAPGAFLAVRTRFLPASRDELAAWWYRMDSTHVGFFSPRSLGLWAARHGLKPIYDDGVDSVTFSGTGRET